MMKSHPTFLGVKAVLSALLLFILNTAGLALDNTFYYSGRIIDSSGKPLSGSLEVMVNFFDTATATNRLNSGSYTGLVNVSDGLFSLPITLSSADEMAIFSSSSVWIEFSNNTNNQIYPRQMFNPVPYALRVPVDGNTIVFNTSGNLQVGSIAVTQIVGLSGLLATKADIANTGNLKMGSGSTLSLGGFATAAQTVLTTTLGTVDAGKTWFNTDTHQIMYWDGSSAQMVGAAGSGLTDFNGQFGSTQMLAVDYSGTAPAWSSAANTHTLHIPQAATVGVTAGLISNADYSSFSAATTKTGYLTVSSATNLDTLSSSISTATSANNPLTLALRDASGGFNAATITAEVKLNLKSTTSNSITLAAPSGMVASTSYTLPAAAVAGALLTTDVSGNLSWISTSSVAPVVSVAGRTGAVTLTTADVAEGANQYFTTTRAQTAAVADALNNGITNVAPSQNAVFNAIATINTSMSTKEPTITMSTNTQYFRGDKTWSSLSADVRAVLSATTPLSYSNLTGVFSLPKATTSTDGYLSSSDWNTFNGKLSSGSLSASAPMSYNSGSGVFSMSQASSSTSGYLTSGDWNTFNNKVSSQWGTSGSMISYGAGNVGIGSASPQNPLDVNGIIHSMTGGFKFPDGTTQITSGISSGSLSATLPMSYNSGSGVFSMSQANSSTSGYLTSGDWNTFNNKVSSQWGTSSSDIYYNSGTVSVGTTAVGSATLLVNGSFVVHGSNFEIDDSGTIDSTAVRLFSAAGSLYLQNGSGGATIFRSKTAAANMTIFDNGNVGLGTSSAPAKLTVGGTAGTDGIQFPDGSLQTSASQTSVTGSAVLGSAYIATASMADTGLAVTLPSAGTYLVKADVRAALNLGASGSGWCFLNGELYNATTSSVIPYSQTMISLVSPGGNNAQSTSVVESLVTVTAANSIHLYVSYAQSGTGCGVNSNIASDGNGYTKLWYIKMGK